MLTKGEITTASNVLDETDVLMLVSLIRNSVRYRSNPFIFAGLEEAIISLSGTIKARQINAMLAKIEALGVGEVAIKGGEDSLYYSQAQEREAMLNYILSVLYSISEGNFLIIPDGLSDAEIQFLLGRYSTYRAGQRPIKANLI